MIIPRNGSQPLRRRRSRKFRRASAEVTALVGPGRCRAFSFATEGSCASYRAKWPHSGSSRLVQPRPTPGGFDINRIAWFGSLASSTKTPAQLLFRLGIRTIGQGQLAIFPSQGVGIPSALERSPADKVTVLSQHVVVGHRFPQIRGSARHPIVVRLRFPTGRFTKILVFTVSPFESFNGRPGTAESRMCYLVERKAAQSTARSILFPGSPGPSLTRSRS